MADKLSEMTDAKWDKLKKDAKIPNTSVFKSLVGGAANVGGAIKKYQSARAEWKAFKSAKVVMEYFKALGDLEDAFKKFKAIKEFKSNEAKELAKAIDGWLSEASAKKLKVAKFYKDNEGALKANDVAALMAKLDKENLW